MTVKTAIIATAKNATAIIVTVKTAIIATAIIATAKNAIVIIATAKTVKLYTKSYITKARSNLFTSDKL